MKFLDYWISMTQTKEDVMIDSPDPGAEKNYVPYNINKSLSSFWDYIHYVNEMNQLNHLDNKLQYDYFINISIKYMLSLSLDVPYYYYYYPIYLLHNSEKKYAKQLFFLSFFASSPLVYVRTHLCVYVIWNIQ